MYKLYIYINVRLIDDMIDDASLMMICYHFKVLYGDAIGRYWRWSPLSFELATAHGLPGLVRRTCWLPRILWNSKDFHSSLEWSQNWLVQGDFGGNPDIWRSEVNIPLQSIANVESMNHRPVPGTMGKNASPGSVDPKKSEGWQRCFCLDLPKVDKLVKTVGMKCVNMHIDNII